MVNREFWVIGTKLTEQDIDDIMVSALEGGISYWAYRAEVVGEYLGEWASEQISRGGSLEIYLYEPFDAENTKMYTLTLDKFLSGFELWVKNNDTDGAILPDGHVDCGNIDSIRADAIVQYSLFGDIVFG